MRNDEQRMMRPLVTAKGSVKVVPNYNNKGNAKVVQYQSREPITRPILLEHKRFTSLAMKIDLIKSHF